MLKNVTDDFQDIPHAVCALCTELLGVCYRKVSSGLGFTEASVITEEINRAGGKTGACQGQMYNMNTLIRDGSEEPCFKYLPKIARAICVCRPRV